MYNSYMVSVTYTLCLLLHISAKWFVGFADGASFHTYNLASVAWVIYSPSRQLVSSGGAWLGLATNNVDAYMVVIEFL